MSPFVSANPFFAMVVIDTGKRIVAEEPASTDRAIENVEDLNFAGVDDFTPTFSSHKNASWNASLGTRHVRKLHSLQSQQKGP